MKLKKTLGLLLTAALACSMAMPAAAEHYTGADNWNVAFTGKAMESNFKSSVFDDAMTALQPGDSVSLTVHLQNTSTEITDWYMTNEVLRSLEESQQVARSGGYTYELTYTGPNGEQAVLFSSEAIGGEKDQQAGLGLHEATDSLEDFFYLDRLLARAERHGQPGGLAGRRDAGQRLPGHAGTAENELCHRAEERPRRRPL